MTTINDKLREIEERCEAATEGPWTDGYETTITCFTSHIKSKKGRYIGLADGLNSETNGKFIAHSRQDVPALVKALKIAAEVLQPLIYDWAIDATKEIEKALGVTNE